MDEILYKKTNIILLLSKEDVVVRPPNSRFLNEYIKPACNL